MTVTALRLLGVVLIAAAALSARCAPAGAQGIAWDGRGAPPRAEPSASASAHKPARPKPARPGTVNPDGGLSGLMPYTDEWWARKQHLEDAESVRLKRQMSICRTC